MKPPIIMTQQRLDILPEYSISTPTGEIIGKQWKCNANFGVSKPPEWILCEYAEHEDPTKIRILRTPIVIKETMPTPTNAAPQILEWLADLRSLDLALEQKIKEQVELEGAIARLRAKRDEIYLKIGRYVKPKPEGE